MSPLLSFSLPFCPPFKTCVYRTHLICFPITLSSFLFSPQPASPTSSIILSYPPLLFSNSSVSMSLASGQRQLHGVGRADRHQRAGWPQPGNSSAAEVSTLSNRRIALFHFLWEEGGVQRGDGKARDQSFLKPFVIVLFYNFTLLFCWVIFIPWKIWQRQHHHCH